MWYYEDKICQRVGKLTGPMRRALGPAKLNQINSEAHLSCPRRSPHRAGVLTDEIFKGLAKCTNNLGKYGLSQAIRSPWAKKQARQLSGKYIDRALGDLSRKMNGGALDIQKQLAKLGELHMRTPTGKKYIYC